MQEEHSGVLIPTAMYNEVEITYLRSVYVVKQFMVFFFTKPPNPRTQIKTKNHFVSI